VDPSSLDFTPSECTIKALILGLKDSDKDVRESSLNSLGIIGLPFIEPAFPVIDKLLSDEDSGVRAMAVWCIGKAGNADKNSSGLCINIDRIIGMMNDSYWKVKTSACVTIGL
jgi:HEAT repeat protein